MKYILAILIILLLPFVTAVSPLIFVFAIVNRHYEYLEKKKGLVEKENGSKNPKGLKANFSVNEWANKLKDL